MITLIGSLRLMKPNKVYSMLGLATKAGCVKSGEFSTEKAIKSYKAFLVLISIDASDNTKKMFSNMCSFYKVPMYEYGTKEELGHAMGKELRASLAITNQGFADSIRKHLDALGSASEE